MAVRVGINGFGRIGRLGLRAAWQCEKLEFVHVNDISGDAPCQAHLLKFDSVHGRWDHDVASDGEALLVDGMRLGYSSYEQPGDLDWRALGVDLVIESNGKFRTAKTLRPYFDRGVRKVIDYQSDPRSSIVDAPSTRVINQTLVKVLAWYDHEVGYANRMMELACTIAQGLEG